MRHLSHVTPFCFPVFSEQCSPGFRWKVEASPTSPVSSELLLLLVHLGSFGTKTALCLGWLVIVGHIIVAKDKDKNKDKDGAVLGLVAVTIGHIIVTITRYYSDRGTSVVRTVRPNVVASSLLIPNFSLADQVVVSFKIMFINI